jgi:hypothetical protein
MVGKLVIYVIVAVVTGAFATPLTIQPGPEGKDTYIEINDTTPHGDNFDLKVRRGIDAGGLLTCRTFIEFDLSAYSGVTVTQAELRFWSVYGSEPLNPIVGKQVSNSWDEATLIWDNRPGFGGGSFYMAEAGDYYYMDITDLVYQWVTLGIPNYGLCIKFEDESVPNDGIVFYSGDNTDYPEKRPALLIWSPQLAVEPASFGAVKAAFR